VDSILPLLVRHPHYCMLGWIPMACLVLACRHYNGFVPLNQILTFFTVSTQFVAVASSSRCCFTELKIDIDSKHLLVQLTLTAPLLFFLSLFLSVVLLCSLDLLFCSISWLKKLKKRYILRSSF
jgi:hypothetical protein